MKNAAQGMLTFVVSLLFAGGGFVYAGRFDAGLRVGAGFFVIGVAGYVLPALLPASISGWVYLVIMVIAVGFFMGQAIAAAYVATQFGLWAIPRRKTVTAIYILTAGILALILFWGLRTYLLEPFKVTTKSMTPTLIPGDRFLARKIVPGDLKGVLVLYRDDSSGTAMTYVKRVVGVGGDMVRVTRECKLSINGRDAEYQSVEGNEEFVGTALVRETLEGHEHSVLLPGIRACEAQEFHVSPGFAFLLGDLRAESFDSRHHGPISLKEIVGVPTSVWFSLEEGRPRWNRVGLAIH